MLFSVMISFSISDKLNSCKNVSLGGISEGFRLDGESDADVLSRVSLLLSPCDQTSHKLHLL